MYTYIVCCTRNSQTFFEGFMEMQRHSGTSQVSSVNVEFINVWQQKNVEVPILSVGIFLWDNDHIWFSSLFSCRSFSVKFVFNLMWISLYSFIQLASVNKKWNETQAILAHTHTQLAQSFFAMCILSPTTQNARKKEKTAPSAMQEKRMVCLCKGSKNCLWSYFCREIFMNRGF